MKCNNELLHYIITFLTEYGCGQQSTCTTICSPQSHDLHHQTDTQIDIIRKPTKGIRQGGLIKLWPVCKDGGGLFHIAPGNTPVWLLSVS